MSEKEMKMHLSMHDWTSKDDAFDRQRNLKMAVKYEGWNPIFYALKHTQQLHKTRNNNVFDACKEDMQWLKENKEELTESHRIKSIEIEKKISLKKYNNRFHQRKIKRHRRLREEKK
tara:strand:+ start:425 stop:775 length:351 start_codon:yes stop_codon:yes gene_type:complete